MFNNIGKKVKGLATAVMIIGIVVSIILGIVMISNGSQMKRYSRYSSDGDVLVTTGVFTLILGPIFAWLSSWVIYAIGKTAEYDQYELYESLYDELHELRNEVKELKAAQQPVAEASKASQPHRPTSNQEGNSYWNKFGDEPKEV